MKVKFNYAPDINGEQYVLTLEARQDEDEDVLSDIVRHAPHLASGCQRDREGFPYRLQINIPVDRGDANGI